jgi:hypothetical protein
MSTKLSRTRSTAKRTKPKPNPKGTPKQAKSAPKRASGPLESIAYFLSQYGNGERYATMSAAQIATFEKSVPPLVVSVWKEGLRHHGNGFFWWVDPAAYAELAHRVLPRAPAATVIMRTGLGALVIYDKQKKAGAEFVFFNPINGVVTPASSSLSALLNGWFTDDVVLSNLTMYPRYQASVQAHGPVGQNECFAPALPLEAGGDAEAPFVKKDLRVMYSLR